MNAVRIDMMEREKTLQCSELVTLGSVCAFTLYRDGTKLTEDGYIIFRLIGCPPTPGSPPGPYGLGAVAFTKGDTGETDILKEEWLVGKLRHLPVGTVIQVSVTVVTEGEGTAALGTMDVLIPTVAEITERKPWSPYERVAMFRGEQGMPGVLTDSGDPVDEIDGQIRVYVNKDGLPDLLREVPPCPEDAGSGWDGMYVLQANNDGTYRWAKLPTPTISITLSNLPGRIDLVKEGDVYNLVQYMMKWNPSTNDYEEDTGQRATTIGTVDHVDDHSDGVL